MAVGRPPSLGIDKTKAMINGKLAEINVEVNILLHKRHQRIDSRTEESHDKIEDSNQQIMSLRKENSILIESLGRLNDQYIKFQKEVEGTFIVLGCSLESSPADMSVERDRHADEQRLAAFKSLLGVSSSSPASLA